MTLREVVNDLEQLSDEMVIFAAKGVTWQVDSPAVLVESGDMDSIGTHLEDLTYFLEVSIAKEVLEVWSKWRAGRVPTEQQRIEALIYYAENDAYEE
jgi:hypothetical protein